MKDKLNDLDGKEWIKNTKSWFIINPKPRSEKEIQHPAKYPEELVEKLVAFFTKKTAYLTNTF